MHEVIDSLPPAGQGRAEPSRSQTEAVQHTHTHTRLTGICRCVCVCVQATCGTVTEIYADMKNLADGICGNATSVASIAAKVQVARLVLPGSALFILQQLRLRPGPRLVVIQCSNRNLMELTFVPCHNTVCPVNASCRAVSPPV